MPRVLNSLRGFTALVFMLLVAISAVPSSAFAANGNPAYCDSEVGRLTNKNFQDKVPVIMVHGFNGSSQDWGTINTQSSFAAKINNIPGVAVAHLFSYDTHIWVESPSSGPRLAKTIDCVSQLSRHNGGKGKVIIVGYSLGGLVARDALSHRSTDNQRAIADEVGQVITIGTPHTGTTLPLECQKLHIPICGAFTTGSPELLRLPHFPSQTAVHTIAGDVIMVLHDKHGRELGSAELFSDTLVPIDSAHAESSRDAQKGGGQKTIICKKNYRATGLLDYYLPSGNAPCEHTQLTNAANNGVREDTAEAIKKYVAWLNTPPPPNTISLTIGALTTRYDDRWKDVGYGVYGPDGDGGATDTTSSTPTATAFVQIFNLASWGWSGLDCSGLACTVDPSTIVGPAPPVTIGGRTPSSSARYSETGYPDSVTSLAWCFDAEKVCVHYRSGAGTTEPSAALLDLFNTATWSNL